MSKNLLNLHKLGLDEMLDEGIDYDEVDEVDEVEDLDECDNLDELSEDEIEDILDDADEQSYSSDSLPEESLVVPEVEVEEVFSNYLIRILPGMLKCFSGPGKNYSHLGFVKKNEKYTVFEESLDLEENRWGRIELISGSVWVSLTHCERVILCPP